MKTNRFQAGKMLLRLFILTLMGMSAFNTRAQDKILVPYRVGNLFGLSDVNGKMVLSARYAFLSPIGKNVFEFTSIDSANHNPGSNRKQRGQKGILFGTKEIITQSEHNHFAYLDAGIIVGTESAYSSTNSNFYTLKGERLLAENVYRFQMVVSPAAKANKGNIAILAMHMDRMVSILLYDGQKQIMLAPLLDRVSNFKIEKAESYEERVLICTYLDQNGNKGHDVIYYDEKSGEHKRKPYINTQSAQIPEPSEGVAEGAGVGAGEGGGEDYVPVVDGEGVSEEQRPYTHHLQKEPLIFFKDKKYSLYFSENKRSAEIYDSLIYLRNQYIDFDIPISSMFMAGIKDADGKWRFGLLNEKGLLMVPIMYEYIGFSFDELGYKRDEDEQPGQFIFKKQNIYSVDANRCLKTYHQGIFVVKKDGKFGLINNQNIAILPIEFDQIWKNEINFRERYSLNNNLYGYRKGNSYGAFFLDRKKGIAKNTGLIFPKLALSVYEDYMGQKGLDLYNLADPSSLNFCLASNNGLVYYKLK